MEEQNLKLDDVRNLKLEFEDRAKRDVSKNNPAIIDKNHVRIEAEGNWRPTGEGTPPLYPACTGQCGTWRNGFVFDNQGQQVYNGTTFKVVDLEIEEPVAPSDMTEVVKVYHRTYANHTKHPIPVDIALSSSETVTSTIVLSFETTYSAKSRAEGAVAINGLGKVGLSVEFGFEIKAGQEVVHKEEHTVSEKEDFSLTIEPGTKVEVQHVRKTGRKTIEFEARIQARGHYFFWVNWGQGRWAGWPAKQDWANPFCQSASALENPEWVVHGEMSRVKYDIATLDVRAQRIEIKEDATGILEEDLLEQKT